MPMFGNKHFSNPAVGRAKEPEGAAEPGDSPAEEKGEQAKSYHVFHNDDGTAHSHIQHADGSHEHTDHGTPAEAHAHVQKATGGGESFDQWAKEEEQEPEHNMTMHGAARAGGGAF